ncbi:MAG: amidohydrolase [Thermoplasmataceae archaeon]
MMMKKDKVVISDKYFDGEKFIESPTYFKIRNGVIYEVGEVTDIDDPTSRFGNDIEDYRGYTLTPGIIDSHNHFTMTALKMRFQIDLEKATNFTDIEKALSTQVKSDDGKWILGYNLNEFNLEERRLPTTKELDRISPDIPILITHSSEHTATCNSTALQRSNVILQTPDPLGSIIGRYYNGEPNGILYESAAMNLVKKNIPEYTLEEYEEALLYGSKEYRKSGLTAVKDIGGTGNDVDEEKRIKALNRLSEEKSLAIRVGVSIPVFSLTDMRKKIELSEQIRENELLKFVGFKLFIDGSALSRTAWMKEEWNKNYTDTDENNFGKPLWNIEEFNKVVAELSELQTTVSIHAIGDKGISEALKAIKQNGNKCSEFTMIHCNAPSSNDMAEMSDLAVSVETQASFIYFIGAAIMSNFGKVRGERLFPLKSMLKTGINVCNGSDSPVTRYEPIYGILSSINRQTKYVVPSEFEYDDSEKLNLEETFRTFTLNCSKSMEWKEIGKLREGSFADMIIWRKIPRNFNENLDSEELFQKVLFSGN